MILGAYQPRLAKALALAGRLSQMGGRNLRWAANEPIFERDLQRSLDLGATFTRATTKAFTDFEGVTRTALSGEACFEGARRVRNLVPNSDLVTGWSTANASVTAGIADPAGGTRAITLTNTGGGVAQLYTGITSTATSTDSVWLRRRTGTGNVHVDASGAVNLALTTSWQRFAVVGEARSGTWYFNIRVDTAGDAVDVAFPQIEDVTGQSNQNPSEYVSVGVASSPYHGAGVDGVRYFTNLNGNTVSSNVVAEANGAAIGASDYRADAFGPYGYFTEGARTNLCLRSQEFTNAAWLGSSVAIAVADNAAVAPDGTTTAASLTEDTTSAFHYVRQDWTLSATTTYTFSIYVKPSARSWFLITVYDGTNGNRLYFNVAAGSVGSNVELGSNLSASHSIQPQANGYMRCIVTFTTRAGTAINIFPTTATADGSDSYLGTGVLASYVWGADLEAASFASSYIPTTTASVTRNADVLTYPYTGNLDASQGAIYAEVTYPGYLGAPIVSGDADGGSSTYLRTNSDELRMFDGANYNTGADLPQTSSTPIRVAGTWGGTTLQVSYNGTAAAATAFDGEFPSTTAVRIGNNGAAEQWWGTIRKVKIYGRKQTAAELNGMTA